jgi:hypothetical protein
VDGLPLSRYPLFMLLEGIQLVISLDEVWGMNLVSRFPCVIRFWVFLPLDEVLEHSGPAKAPVVNDAFYLVFLLSF